MAYCFEVLNVLLVRVGAQDRPEVTGEATEAFQDGIHQ
jgi:hypothetical protein